MNIKNKLLDVDVLISMGHYVTKIVKATCIGIDTLYSPDNAIRLVIKRGSLKAKKAKRKQRYFVAGPTHSTDTKSDFTTLYLSKVAVRKVSRQPIERLLGVNLHRWSIEELWMRYNMRIAAAEEKYANIPWIHNYISGMPDVEGFIKQLRFVNNIPKIKTAPSIGRRMLLDICEAM